VQGKTHASGFRGFSCRLDHGGFGIEPRAASHKRSQADRQQARSTADVEQIIIAVEGKPFGNSWKNSCE
jgi:hypothetical protein